MYYYFVPLAVILFSLFAYAYCVYHIRRDRDGRLKSAREEGVRFARGEIGYAPPCDRHELAAYHDGMTEALNAYMRVE